MSFNVTAIDQVEGLAAAFESCAHYIVRDIKAKFDRYGAISERQAELCIKLAGEAQRPTEPHVTAPTGRVEVTGEIVSVKSYRGDFRTVTKMLVKVSTPAGSWRAWGTMPASLMHYCAPVGETGAEKGDTIAFTATLKHGDEPHFAKFSRPTAARIVRRAPAVGAETAVRD